MELQDKLKFFCSSGFSRCWHLCVLFSPRNAGCVARLERHSWRGIGRWFVVDLSAWKKTLLSMAKNPW